MDHDRNLRNRRMTKVFKALSDGTRQQILQLLEEEQYSVGEIVAKFDLSQPTISRHLSVLKEADLVIDERRGQNVHLPAESQRAGRRHAAVLRAVSQLPGSIEVAPTCDRPVFLTRIGRWFIVCRPRRRFRLSLTIR